MMNNANLIPMICGHCGAALPMPKGIARMVRCSFCGTMHLINWNSANGTDGNSCTATAMLGLSGEKSEDNIKKSVGKMLLSSKCPPLDVFDEGIVDEVVEVGVPAFWFDDCTVRGHILYEKKYTFTTTHEEGEGNNRHTVKDTNIEWRHHTLDVSEVTDFIVSANKEYSEIIKHFYYYKDLDAGKDIEFINSMNVEDMMDNDLPESKAFKNDIEPELESRMMALAQKQLVPPKGDGNKRKLFGIEIKDDQEIRNISVSGVELDKRPPKMIWIALCKVLYRYKDKVYPLYLSHDGTEAFYKDVPMDNERLGALQGLRQKAEEKEKEIYNQLFTYNVIAVIAALAGLFSIFSGSNADDMVLVILGIVGGIVLLAVSVIMFYKRIKEGKRLLPDVEKAWDMYEREENKTKRINQIVRINQEILERLYEKG